MHCFSAALLLGCLTAGSLSALADPPATPQASPAAAAASTPPSTPGGRILRCENIIPASAEEIFKGFQSSEGLVKLWGVAQADVDFRIGGQMRTRYDKEGKLGEPGTIINTILAFEPARMLAVKPTAPEGAPSWLKTFCGTGWTVLRLEPLDATHTRLSCTQMGYGEGPDYDQAYEFFDKGNRWTLEKMAAAFTGETTRPSAQAHAGEGHTPAPIDASLFVASGSPSASIVKEAVVNAPPSEVFKAWTTEEGLKSFLGINSKVDLRIGGPMEFYFGPDNPYGQRGSEGCQVLSYLPDRMLSFSWNAPPTLPAARQKRTWIVITFAPVEENKTAVRFVHTGFGDGGEWPEVRKYFEAAWPRVLEALTKHFAAK